MVMVGGEYTQRRNAEQALKLPLNALALPALLTLTQSVWHCSFYLRPFAIPLWGDAQMTSAKLSRFWTPSLLLVSTKFTQPLFLWSEFSQPPLPLRADVICVHAP